MAKRTEEHHRGFLLATVTFSLLVGLASVAYRIAGERGVGALARSRGLDTAGTAELALRAEALHAAFVAAAICLLALAAVGFFWRTRRWPVWLGVGLVGLWWLAVELFAAPHLAVPLGLVDYYAVRDPDHRPIATNPQQGWNEDSVRTRWPASDFRPERFNLVFLGDSFTFGEGLVLRETFPDKVERGLRRAFPALDVRVANFGWISSSPLLSYRRLVDLGDRYHPDLVVVCVDMTDFRDDLLWRNMLERRGIYWLYDRLPLTLKTLEVLAPSLHRSLYAWSGIDMPHERFFVTEQPLEVSRPHMEPLAENLDRIHAWCEERGIGFVVFALPRTYQYSRRESPKSWEADQYTVLGPHHLAPFEFFDELAARVDYPIHSLLPAFRDSRVFPTAFEDDPHWNDAGTTVAARAIASALSTEIGTRGGPPDEKGSF